MKGRLFIIFAGLYAQKLHLALFPFLIKTQVNRNPILQLISLSHCDVCVGDISEVFQVCIFYGITSIDEFLVMQIKNRFSFPLIHFYG